MRLLSEDYFGLQFQFVKSVSIVEQGALHDVNCSRFRELPGANNVAKNLK